MGTPVVRHPLRLASAGPGEPCSASYSAFDQPAPEAASLCSGMAAARKAARSGVTTVLPSLRNSSASFCSLSRIWFEAREAASSSTALNVAFSASLRRPQTCDPTIDRSDSVMWPVSMMWLCTS